MDAMLYPLAASKMLRHCEIYLSMMRATNNEEDLVELAFNEFIASADRTIQYLHKEVNKIGGESPAWFKNRRDNLPYRSLFYELRHIIAHQFFIPLTPIIVIDGDVPSKNVQITEYRLDLQMLPNDKDFDKKRDGFIKELGPSINAVILCTKFFNNIDTFIKEAEAKYDNQQHYLRSKVKSSFRVNNDLTLSHYERQY